MAGLMGMAERYFRHISLKEIGVEGQDRIGQLKVLVVGAGGLGTPAASYLAAAGVGSLGVVDPDRVDITNLQRQILYRDQDVGSGKAEVFAERVAQINPSVRIDAFAEAFTLESARRIASGYDIIVGATDNFASRRAIAETCFGLGIPYIYGGVRRFEVQVMSVLPGKTCCYSCIYGDAADADERPEGPVGAVAGIGGSLQALEALKVGAGFGDPLYDRLLVLDGGNMDTRVLKVKRRSDCEVCGLS